MLKARLSSFPRGMLQRAQCRAPRCSRVRSARPDPDTDPERAPHRRLLHRRQLAPKLSQAGEAGERGGWRGTVFPKRAAAERAEQNRGLCNPRLEQQQALHCTVLQESTCVSQASLPARPNPRTLIHSSFCPTMGDHFSLWSLVGLRRNHLLFTDISERFLLSLQLQNLLQQFHL